jgi:putative ABC transport system permease protein
LSMLTKDFSKLLIISSLIAIPMAWYSMNLWLESFAYKISVGADVMIIAVLLAALITITTISFQSLKAALANPANTLRNND